MSLHTFGFRQGYVMSNPFRSEIYSVPDSAFKRKHLIKQYVWEVVEFSSQYGSEHSISYTACNIAGKPSIFPRYGDYSETYFPRTYGPWWKNLPSAKLVHFQCSSISNFQSREFIEVHFERRVYPVSLAIYEVFNPSAVARILCYSTEEKRWDTLWQGEPRAYPKLPQKFCPKLKVVNYETNTFRVELQIGHLPYYYAIDAIKLTGSETFIEDTPGIAQICSKEECEKFMDLNDESNVWTMHNNNNNNSDGDNGCYFEKLPRRCGFSLVTLGIVGPLQSMRNIKYAMEIKNLCKIMLLNISLCKREVLLLVLSHLDIESLCAVAKTSSFFKKLCDDPLLYRELDLQPYWPRVTDATLEALQKKCLLIQRLNLSWCGSRRSVSTSTFIGFLKACCNKLTCLKISNCIFVDNSAITAVAEFCPLLQVLDLKNCRSCALDGSGLSEIKRLVKLKYLDLYRTFIDQNAILSIVRSCTCLEHLFLGNCINIDDFDEVAMEIARCLRNIRSLDFWKAITLTGIGVNALASNCYNLTELDLGWCREVEASTNCIIRLVSECRNIRKLFLTGIRTVTDSEITAIANHCRELEQLDIMGTHAIYHMNARLLMHRLLESCKNLKLLDVSFCSPEIHSVQRYLQAKYPNVHMHFSFKPSEYF